MRVLAFASQKSGAGKTTLAGHIAVQAHRAGMKPVVLVDLDPDASLTDWFALREEDDEPLQVARSTLKDLSTKLQQLRADGVELVVIDTPPTLNQAIDESIIAADLVAIPTRPCAHDLAAAGATVELVQSHGKPFCFVVNGTEPDGEMTADVVMALAQHGSIASVSIPRSVAMLETMVDGRTVMELPDNPAPASEVARLWDYLAKRLIGVPERQLVALLELRRRDDEREVDLDHGPRRIQRHDLASRASTHGRVELPSRDDVELLENLRADCASTVGPKLLQKRRCDRMLSGL